MATGNVWKADIMAFILHGAWKQQLANRYKYDTHPYLVFNKVAFCDDYDEKVTTGYSHQPTSLQDRFHTLGCLQVSCTYVNENA